MKNKFVNLNFKTASGVNKCHTVNTDHILYVSQDYDNSYTIHFVNGETVMMPNETYQQLINSL